MDCEKLSGIVLKLIERGEKEMVLEKDCPRCGSPVYFEAIFDEEYGRVSHVTILNFNEHQHCGLSKEDFIEMLSKNIEIGEPPL